MRKGFDNFMVIRKIRNQKLWQLKSKTTGKVLGTFTSKALAIKRERQIQYFKRKDY